MNKTLLAALNSSERLLIAETESAQLALLDEDDTALLHTRVLRARNKAQGVYRRGAFGAGQNWLVYLVLCGYATGILATTTSRLLQNTFYALGDTKYPARIAALRVVTSAAVAVPLMFWLDRFPLSTLVPVTTGSRLYLGPVGLATASGFGAWMELYLLRRSLRRRVPGFHLPIREDLKMAGLALAAILPGATVWWLLPAWSPLVTAACVVRSKSSSRERK